ncbi:MAG: tRNA pseudouridine(55) synthase TruB [Nitrospinales bacterium]
MMNGIVNIYKEAGPTSFATVDSVKKILGAKKAGHIGTLDPQAEGVLPVCLNKSTKIIQFLTRQSKVYTATMVLGTATDTQDGTGKVISQSDPGNITEDEVKEILMGFEGEQEQIPPMFSAKKKDGIPLYKLARNGITIDRNPVPIHLHWIKFLNKEEARVTFQVSCSAGTYIRTLCHDVGAKLGCGAHMLYLLRNRVGDFDLGTAASLEELKSANTGGNLDDKIQPVEEALGFMPEIRVKRDHVESIAQGISPRKSSLEQWPDKIKRGMNVRVSNGNHRLIAIAESLTDQKAFAELDPEGVAFKLKRVLI